MKNSKVLILAISLFFFSCSSKQSLETQKSKTAIQNPITAQTVPNPPLTDAQEEIITEHYENGAANFHYYSQDWQIELSKGLAKDSTIAFLWQQKAMGLFKHRKYEAGMEFLDKAVRYNPYEYQDYRAFMKCIFSKTYHDAISDFEECKSYKGNSYVMDHSYNFYIALSKLQLNEFEEAEEMLTLETDRQLQELGPDWVHYLNLFYLGITHFEQKDYKEAVAAFDQTLALYSNFAEALFYKAKSKRALGDKKESDQLFEEAIKYGQQGLSINEDNEIYEMYPYQVRWKFYKYN